VPGGSSLALAIVTKKRTRPTRARGKKAVRDLLAQAEKKRERREGSQGGFLSGVDEPDGRGRWSCRRKRKKGLVVPRGGERKEGKGKEGVNTYTFSRSQAPGSTGGGRPLTMSLIKECRLLRFRKKASKHN